ncbi:hypothetical protein KSX_71010 [Ktedonospora formicarum]|uniref:Uncharacterized protein n=1 Tax=Ktedonospora formicarum TaxID=2778364 RepID=A0A8J3I853_9CHLR|nr:hypothetical protein KSX_71010 [Ktedonospora formicarum]
MSRVESLCWRVTAAISDTGVNASHLETSLVSVLRAFVLPSMTALGFRQLLLILVEEPGIAYHLTIREDHKGRQAKISAYRRLDGGKLTIKLCQ